MASFRFFSFKMLQKECTQRIDPKNEFEKFGAVGIRKQLPSKKKSNVFICVNWRHFANSFSDERSSNSNKLLYRLYYRICCDFQNPLQQTWIPFFGLFLIFDSNRISQELFFFSLLIPKFDFCKFVLRVQNYCFSQRYTLCFCNSKKWKIIKKVICQQEIEATKGYTSRE